MGNANKKLYNNTDNYNKYMNSEVINKNIDFLLKKNNQYDDELFTLEQTSDVNLVGSPVQMGGQLKYLPTRKKTPVDNNNNNYNNNYNYDYSDNNTYTNTNTMSELQTLNSEDVMTNLSKLMNGGTDYTHTFSMYDDYTSDNNGNNENNLELQNLLANINGGNYEISNEAKIDKLIKNIMNNTVHKGGSNLSEFKTVDTEHQMSLKNIVLEKLNNQTGGDGNNNLEHLYNSIGNENLQKLKDMINSEKNKMPTHVGGYDEDNEDNEDNKNNKNSDDSEDNEDSEDKDKDKDSDDKDNHSENSDDNVNSDDDKDDDDDDDDDDGDKDKDDDDDDDDDDDKDDDDKDKDNKDDDDDDDKDDEQSGGNSESFNSSDFRRLHAYMNSENDFVNASNSPHSSESFKLDKADMFTTDSVSNFYSGLNTASEYYNSLKNRATL